MEIYNSEEKMKIQDIKIEEFADTSRWVLLDRMSNEQQIVLKFGHINPEVSMDTDKGESFKVIKEEQNGNVIETTISVGIKTLKGKMADYYEGMIGLIEMGLLPTYTVEDIHALRERVNSVVHEEHDYWADISVIDYKDKKSASQALENLSTQFTKGISDTPIPGAPDGMTIKEAFENPLIREAASKQGISEKQMDEALEELKKASLQMKKDIKEVNMRYEIGQYDKYPCVFLYPPPSTKTEKKKEKTEKGKEIKRADGSVMKINPSGGIDTIVNFPPDAFKKEALPMDGRILQAIQIDKYIVSGGLLTTLNCMPSGKSFCQSLTKSKTVTKTTHEDGIKYITHWIIPLNSTLGEEGYMNREEVNTMISKLLTMF